MELLSIHIFQGPLLLLPVLVLPRLAVLLSVLKICSTVADMIKRKMQDLAINMHVWFRAREKKMHVLFKPACILYNAYAANLNI